MAGTDGRRRGTRLAGELLLGVLGIAGAAGIAWVAASLVFGLSLIAFATGSMAPAIPAGSLAVVREVPAADLETGQVVTLHRAGDPLPITHRVIAIDPDPDDPAGRIVRMQGDANPVPDTRPYRVDTGKVVLWSAPGLARVAHAARSPLALGALTIGCALLVVWAFWPRRSQVSHEAT